MKKEILTCFSKEKIKLEYLSFSDANTLKSISEFNDDSKTAVCIAAYIDRVRLIDNIILNT